MDEERRLVRLEVASHLDAARYAEAVAVMEPNVPWRRTLLERRAEAYKATGNPRAPLARRELERFLKLEPPPFAAAMEPSAQPAPPAPTEVPSPGPG